MTSIINNPNSTTETLATGVVLIRLGNLRILRIAPNAYYSNITSITLPTADRPSSDVEFMGLKHYGGAYDGLAIGYVHVTGKISCVYFPNYHGSAYSQALTGTDNFIGQAIWTI